LGAEAASGTPLESVTIRAWQRASFFATDAQACRWNSAWKLRGRPRATDGLTFADATTDVDAKTPTAMSKSLAASRVVFITSRPPQLSFQAIRAMDAQPVYTSSTGDWTCSRCLDEMAF
jgi:hypothetical protein